MSQESLVLVAGFLVLLVPSLGGIPNAYDKWILGALGAFIAVIGYRLRRAAYLRSLETSHGERRADAFVENPTPSRIDSPVEQI